MEGMGSLGALPGLQETSPSLSISIWRKQREKSCTPKEGKGLIRTFWSLGLLGVLRA